MKEMIKELQPFKKQILIIFIMIIGSMLSNLALPMYLSNVINLAIPNEDNLAILQYGLIMLIFVFAGSACSIAIGYFSALVSTGVGKTLRNKVFRKVQEFSQAEFDTLSTSSLITRTNNDVIQIQTFINIFLRVSLLSPIMAVGGIVMALAKSVSMSMILLISMPVLLVFLFSRAKKIMPLSTEMQQHLDRINLVIREKLTGIRVARTFGTENYEEERFEKVNRSFMEHSIQLGTVMATLMPMLNLILYGTSIALISFGGAKIIRGSSIPIGDVIAVVQYVMQIMMSVLMLSMIFFVYPRASVSSKRIHEVLNIEVSIQNPISPIRFTDRHGLLSFRNVTFAFPSASTPALKNISFDSNPGEVTAIIGSTGSGKSTLLNLIPRFHDVQEGEITIDGINIKDLDLSFLRSKIALVPQKTFLFQGTIEENVNFGNESLCSKKVEHALKIAQSYDFVTEKQEGLLSPVMQGGTNLSGGQRQRLAIARAIAREPEIYLFDDSFSALDFKTDSSLRRALLSETKHATVILVAQRISTVKDADRILVLEKGHCVGIGKHEELLKNCNVYREIVSSQLSKEEV